MRASKTSQLACCEVARFVHIPLCQRHPPRKSAVLGAALRRARSAPALGSSKSSIASSAASAALALASASAVGVSTSAATRSITPCRSLTACPSQLPRTHTRSPSFVQCVSGWAAVSVLALRRERPGDMSRAHQRIGVFVSVHPPSHVKHLLQIARTRQRVGMPHYQYPPRAPLPVPASC